MYSVQCILCLVRVSDPEIHAFWTPGIKNTSLIKFINRFREQKVDIMVWIAKKVDWYYFNKPQMISFCGFTLGLLIYSNTLPFMLPKPFSPPHLPKKFAISLNNTNRYIYRCAQCTLTAYKTCLGRIRFNNSIYS